MPVIEKQNKLSDRGNRLEVVGKVARPNNVVTDAPYTDIIELVRGYSVVKANSIDDATELAKGCPILTVGGNVEVREISMM